MRGCAPAMRMEATNEKERKEGERKFSADLAHKRGCAQLNFCLDG
eukprot:CAMPEP_0194760560 /NCGR_PEP_ID=MMETSP0323_2-20130528/13447_1 /TAXON_ID=2866 ORGANISM="Crypthecodinium cohnii, Strain Seligo" /NCGR_SAMPLE_ID=MMETSP0323_2 /ASSEMBLY_ACC=CAM_ASM_000346 /LENGTH=44 /DNA_ID= /DNA_START= /DNA_END= /DNA_ORIENTATION=